jgi:hypothetical protein
LQISVFGVNAIMRWLDAGVTDALGTFLSSSSVSVYER